MIFLKECIKLLRYFSFAFFCTLIFSFKNFFLLILFFFYPIAKIFKKKLLILHTLELINIFVNLTFFLSSFFTLVFLNFLIIVFFSPSWYKIQIFLFVKFLKQLVSLLGLNLICFYVTNFFIFNLSLIWNFGFFNSFNLFEIQFQLNNFLKFQLNNFFLFCFSFIFFWNVSLIIKWFFSWKFLFFIFKKLKVILFFLFFLVLSIICSNFNCYFFLLIFSIFIILEIFFFYMCLKIS
uniref:Sec-independent protein translocase component TatC n=1 Tax=Melanothamnus gigas TaxID=3016206 RepID=A0A9F1U5E3_9FLOR|nr:Sec-independent protein translocase component TatC [Melanothamnus gigas]WAX04176.1 Sec-independent protein translocase component TatC [Melanothamnus gigas]